MTGIKVDRTRVHPHRLKSPCIGGVNRPSHRSSRSLKRRSIFSTVRPIGATDASRSAIRVAIAADYTLIRPATSTATGISATTATMMTIKTHW